MHILMTVLKRQLVITAEGLTNFLLSQEHGILKFLYVVNSFVVSPFASTAAFVLKVD